ncbi:MAG: chromosome segregation protein SMC [Clostridiales bacterium]|nr:chromosome segregation protein SMC [Clostridiales bacterium]
MYLKALEIQGFKSFPDKTVLTFGEAITAIVGPNGSGKSNIADAIRWVLGEQSTRALRGGKMEDVIFGGTARRKQLGYAEVSLILDNSDGSLPLEESEVMVTRRYYRSGEGEYFLNRSSCRLRDVNDLFMDTGMGREGYSIIGQGKIDEILSTRSGERRAVFEEAAGISRYRHRKEDAERKLERTQDNLLRIGDKIAELELQLEPLEQQAEKAKQYLTIRDRLKGLEISLWMDNLDQLRQQSRKLQADCDAAARQRDEAAAAQEKLYARAEEIAAQMRQQDVEADRIRSQISDLESQANSQESEIAVLKAQVRSNEENAQRLQMELEQQAGRAGSIAAQIEQRQQRLDEIEERQQEVREALSQREQEATANQQQSSQLAEQIYRLQEQEAIQNASAADAKALLSALAASEQELLDRETSLQGQIQENDDLLKQTQQEAEVQKKHRADLREQAEGLQNVLGGYQLRLRSRQQRLKGAEDQVNRLTVEEGGLRHRVNLLSEMERMYEGYSKAVKSVMQAVQRRQLTGVHGPVASLIQAPEQYTVAIEIALGGAMQNLVVSTEEDGKAAIQYLKRRDAGRATFLPLSAVRPNALRDQGVERCPGFVGIASELVTCQDTYRDIAANLLGRVVVVEDMDAAIAMARRYRYHFKIVTLDGQVLNPGGSMTGGSVSRSAGILSRARELERLQAQQAQLQSSLDKARKDRDNCQREVNSASYELEVAQRQQQDLDGQIRKAETEILQSDLRLSTLRDNRTRWKGELDAIAQRTAQIEADTQEAQGRIAQLEGEAAALRAQSEAKAQGREDYQKKSEELAQATAALHVEEAALEGESAAAQKALEELQSLERDITGDRDSRLRQIADCESRGTELLERIRQREDQLSALQSRKTGLNEQLTQMTANRLTQEKQRVEADKAARDKNAELLNMERECAALEQKRSGAAMEEKQLLDKLWENYELTYDSAQSQRQELESPAKAARQIAEGKRQISALGTVNVGAIEEYRRIRERYDYLTGQRDDVEQSKAELETIIGEITGEMANIFQTQFDRINGAFTQTFQELFGGGTARLELEDPADILNCGIEIKAQPPGKALKTLTLLSGGERAFVAIALYFAFLKVRPAPFVVMDEIEAALDDNNVVRFANYMRGMSDKTQFIVITHRRGTMEEADILYGVTMQERGVSRMLSLDLNEAEKAIKSS